MKAEGSSPTFVVALHQVKVKEENDQHVRINQETSSGDDDVTDASVLITDNDDSVQSSAAAKDSSSTKNKVADTSRHHHHHHHHQQENKTDSSTSATLKKSNGSESSGNESPPSRSIKPEDSMLPSQLTKDDDTTVHTTGGVRCINTIFSGHTKLKRLLGTLVEFATNLSSDIGESVRTLVLNLLSGKLTAEDFHTALQQATNFPLRDFVLPYLRHTLPSLRKNLTAAARANNQTCIQYLRLNESVILDTVRLVSSGDTVEVFGDYTNNGNNLPNIIGYGSSRTTSQITEQSNTNIGSSHHLIGTITHTATKRRGDSLYCENGTTEEAIYGKRSANSLSQQQQQQHHHRQSDYCWYHPVHSTTTGTIHNYSQTYSHTNQPPNLIQMNQLSSYSQQSSSHDDEWKNIHVMLNCILGMVEKTKRALVILQKRGCTSPSAATSPLATGFPSPSNGTGSGNGTADGGNLKQLSGEILAQTIRATEDRIAAQVKKRTDEAVQEVKRVALAQVQRAVAEAVAESRTNERLRVHQLLDIPMPQPSQTSFLRLSNQVDSGIEMTSELSVNTADRSNSSADDDKESGLTNVGGSSCWNCARPALETCGGCGIARYCGSFCQHRDWEAGKHHATCNSSLYVEHRRATSRSPTKIANNGNGNHPQEVTTTPTAVNKRK